MGRPRKEDTRYEVSRWGRAIPYTTPTGIKTYLYNIGTVAEAIRRTSQTIRRWEDVCILPKPPFKVGGKRFYSDEHIDAIVECLEKSNVRPGVKIQDTSFIPDIYKRYEEIYNNFCEVKNNEAEKSGKKLVRHDSE